jgi:hypothetical protein
MVRKHNLARQVVLTADPDLMDAEYLATCMQKAASGNVKDMDLWRGYIGRLEELVEEIPPQYFGYIVWSIGRVQVPHKQSSKLYFGLMERAEQLVSELTSSGLMAVLWTFRRALIKPSDSLLRSIANRVVQEPQSIRPSDFMKICNSLGFFGFGKLDKTFRDRISRVAINKFESDTFAQDFRSAIDPLAIANVYNDEARAYILDRFRKIFITARPNHLLHAYHSSVVMRVLAPDAWFNLLSDKTRGFYTSLAQRHIATRSRGMCKLHRQVSDELAGPAFKLAHRNMFRWGPFWIDIGIEESEDLDSHELTDDEKTCIVLDKPSSFYANDKRRLTEKAQLEHVLLSSVGWKVKHVNHYEWSKAQDKAAYLRSVLA